jgi:hypothetical protein
LAKLLQAVDVEAEFLNRRERVEIFAPFLNRLFPVDRDLGTRERSFVDPVLFFRGRHPVQTEEPAPKIGGIARQNSSCILPACMVGYRLQGGEDAFPSLKELVPDSVDIPANQNRHESEREHQYETNPPAAPPPLRQPSSAFVRNFVRSSRFDQRESPRFRFFCLPVGPTGTRRY